MVSVSLSVTDCGVAYTPGTGEAVGSGGGGGAGVPVPASGTLWVVAASVGLASSVTTRLALRAAADPGLKVKLTVQVPTGPTAVPTHVLVWAKSAALVPLSATELTWSGELPVFFTVTVWGALVKGIWVSGKVTVAGVTLATGAGVAPLRATVSGPVTSPGMLRDAAWVAARAVGLKVVAMANSAALTPEMVGAPTVMAAALEFVTVTVWAALVVPTAWAAKARLLGAWLRPGASWAFITNRLVWMQLGPASGAGQAVAGSVGVGLIPVPSIRKTLLPVGLPVTAWGVTPSERNPAGGAGRVASQVRKGSKGLPVPAPTHPPAGQGPVARAKLAGAVGVPKAPESVVSLMSFPTFVVSVPTLKVLVP